MGSPAEYVIMPTGNEVDVNDQEPVLDLVHLSRQTLGDASLETELLTLFERQAQQLALRLSEPGGAMEGRQRAGLAHMLTGSARVIGAFGVARAAEAYEAALKSGSEEAAASELRRLTGAIATVRQTIANLLERVG